MDMEAFLDEMTKIAAAQQREATNPWAPKSIGAPRSKMPKSSTPKAPSPPGKLSPRLVKPTQYGKRQNYSKPITATPPETNPTQSAGLRSAPPPHVVFGVR